MYKGKKVIVVLFVYNVVLIFEKIYKEIFFDLVDEVIFCDDVSKDNIFELVRLIGIEYVIIYQINKGYGGN